MKAQETPREKYFFGEIEKLIQELYLRICQKSLIPLSILPLALLRKIQNSVRAVFLLLENKLIHDSAILLRSISEATIFLVASIKEKDFFSEYADSGLVKRLRIIRARKAIDKRFRMGMDNESLELEKEIEKLLNKEPCSFLRRCFWRLLRKKSQKKKIRFIDTKKLAQKYHLEELYHQYYEYGSDAMHNMPTTLDPYIAFEESGRVFELIEYPDLHDEPLIMAGILHCLFIAMRQINEATRSGLESRITDLENNVNAVVETEMREFIKNIEKEGKNKGTIIDYVRQLNQS